MKALILAPFDARCLQELQGRVEVIYESWLETKRLYDPEELAARLEREKIEILVVEADFVLEEVFEGAPGLRFVGICRNATGHVDARSATEQGVLVVNTPARNSNAVAELVIGLMMSLARRIPAAHNLVVDGGWKDPVSPYLELRGTELAGKTLGIVGLGSIGSMLAEKAAALDMEVVAHDPYVAPETGAIRLTGLDELLRISDFVSLHLPAAPEVEGLMSRDEMRAMKPTAYLLNTSNPQAVDEKALVGALCNGEIAGAGLDVYETAPLPPDHPLLALENVVLTPHIGGATDDTVARHSRTMKEAIFSFLDGVRPDNLVNPVVWK